MRFSTALGQREKRTAIEFTMSEQKMSTRMDNLSSLL